MRSPLARLPGIAVLSLVLALAGRSPAEDSRAALDYFEREVRPVLVNHCQECHGAKKQESSLRLDSREAVLQGGLSGPAIVPSEPGKSLLIAAIRHEGDVQMPPKAKLTEAQIAAVSHWVKLGAPWPKDDVAGSKTSDAARTHFAFQPVRDPEVPVVVGNTSPNPIDAFIRAKLAEKGLPHAPRADVRTLMRRASYDLTGLPPSPADIESLVSPSPTPPLSRSGNEGERGREGEWEKAYEKYVDGLLASPHYGEQWGRHWLDVARYSDTKGYVYGREQRMWVHAWAYRDWVVQALNDDLPYNRFLLLQIAADQVAPDDKGSWAAMGFLTLGRRFLGVQRDIIDDRIDVVTRGTMGLTVGCARCHDHKYDPIPTRDYYALYGVFQSCVERIESITQPPVEAQDEAYKTYTAELEKRRKALADKLAAVRLETAKRNRARVGDYLAAQLELHKYPAEGFDQILEKTDLLPNFVRVWQAYLAAAEKSRDPIFTAWHAYADIPQREFAAKSAAVTTALAARPVGEVHPLVAARFASPPASMPEVAKRYGELFADIERQWQELTKAAEEKKEPTPTALPDAAAEALRQVIYDRRGPCEVPDEPIVNIEYVVDSGSNNELWKLQNELDNWMLQSPPALRHAIVLTDRDVPTTPRVFKRGNPANPGDEVPRQFVEVLAGANRQPFSNGSGRLELAQAIVDPANPLTARVIVNRVWAHHFGAGLVRTPSDFGTRAEPPSHPELLDWLTSRFLEDGWSLKKLHRRIMLSETYQQSSSSPEPPAPNPVVVDPENRLLWRFSPRRLAFEELRDSLVVSSGKLDPAVGGRAGDLFSPAFTRRSLYGTIDRQFLPSTLRIFDFANPDLHIPLRSETTVPQQALFFLNHPLAIGYAQQLAARTASETSGETRVQALYRFAYQRPASPAEVQVALEFIRAAEPDAAGEVPPAVTAWQYGFGAFDEKSQRVTSFERLPHFTGSAWQGGANWPDAKLGWVQLTASGGHPGNDLAHAAIRRWTAPQDMTVRIASTLVHEPAEGDGVRGFLVSSRTGLVKEAKVHHGQAELGAESLELKAGDTLDFVTDIGNKLAYNQFLWKAKLTAAGPSGPTFDSERDFAGQPTAQLSPWEQLAQVLLSANEFVFVD
jgi:mono/diheme cytochrome c family protein